MRIEWTTGAANDLNNICDYTEEHHGASRARRTALQIYRETGRLAPLPYVGRPGRKAGTRELVFADLPFLAIYRIRAEVVEIVRILHGAQRWP